MKLWPLIKKHETSTQCRFNVGTASWTLVEIAVNCYFKVKGNKEKYRRQSQTYYIISSLSLIFFWAAQRHTGVSQTHLDPDKLSAKRTGQLSNMTKESKTGLDSLMGLLVSF